MVDFLMIPFGLGRDTLYFLRLDVMLSGFKSPSHSRFALVRRRVLFLKKEGVAVADLGERSGVSLFPFSPPPSTKLVVIFTTCLKPKYSNNSIWYISTQLEVFKVIFF